MKQANDRDFSQHMKRIAWADYAKGICIVLVVMLYAVERVQGIAGHGGWLDVVVAFAKPFRMPDFFFVSGVLLTLAIHRDWRTFFDRKVVHFAYFYALWLTILIAFSSRWIAAEAGWPEVGARYLKSFYHPYSMLWFIYLLPIFFVLTKALHRVSPVLVWLCAAALQVAQPETGIKVLDKFAPYYVFFYSGFLLSPYVMRFADAVSARPVRALICLGLWAVLETYLVFADYALLPGVSLALGLLGASVVIAVSSLMAKTRAFAPLAYCGRNSLAVYLGFAIPLAVAAKLLFSSAWIANPGSIAALVTLAAIAGALALHRLVRDTAFRFLFERPARFRLRATSPRREARPLPKGA